MSVYGGDSWGREAQHRKRRVDDLVVEALNPSSYKMLSGGKFACLVCPHNPVLDTSLMLSMHFKGSRHRAAESRLKEKQLVIHDEIAKRIALAECSESLTSTAASPHGHLAKKPLIEQARKAASDILRNRNPQQNKTNLNNDVKSNIGQCRVGSSHSTDKEFNMEGVRRLDLLQQYDLQERRERELKFTAAGWKRDGHGNWYRDEDVEFDSDEEDPNVSLA